MLPILPLRLHFTALTDGDLGEFAGSLWRSVMGLHLKRRHCLGGEGPCALGNRCVYHAVMSPIPPAHALLISGKSNAPPPYILSPVSTGAVSATDEVVLNLTLIGQGARHASDVIRALKAGAEQGLGHEDQRLRLQLDSVRHALASTEPDTSYAIDPAQPPLASLPPAAPPAPHHIRVQLESPLRLRENEQYLRPQQFTVRAFFKSLLLRVHNLTDTYAPTPLAWDATQLLATCSSITLQPHLRWQRQRRWSTRQRSTVEGSGLLGHFDLDSIDGQPIPEDLWQLLWMGQWLHLGKGTVMGLGRYRLETAPI